MVARSPSVGGFVPAERPRVVVAADGTLAAIHEPSRVSIVEIPSCTSFAELGTDADAEACEVAWVGTPPRLLVLSRHEAHSTVHLVDPFGPRTIAELRVEQPLRLYASVGSYALATGAAGAFVFAASDKALTPYSFPARAVPFTAGAAGSQFVVALTGAIEEWDPVARMPKRRLKLQKPVTITAVGGSDRVVWMTTQQEPRRIDVIPLVNRGQPKMHELPEPIAEVASHPRSDLIACIGATSGRVWVVDLDGRVGLRMVGPVGIDRAEAVAIVIGRVAGVLAAQAEHATTVVQLERSEPPAEVEAPRARVSIALPTEKLSTLYGDENEDHSREEGPTSVTPAPAPGEPLVTASPAKPIERPPLPAFGAPVPEPAVTAPLEVAEPRRSPTTDDRRQSLAEWRDRVDSPRARTAEPLVTAWPDVSDRWREALVTWSGLVVANPSEALPDGVPFESLAMRLDLEPPFGRVLALAYAHHLRGHDGIAAVDVANLLVDAPDRWAEALGRGELIARGALTYRGSRLRLTDAVLRVLDDAVPMTGSLVGAPGTVSLLGPCVIVASGPLSIIAEACLASIGGAILAGSSGVDPAELVAEGRAYGAAPMWRVRADLLARVPSDRPIILVADDDATAEQLGVPRLT